MIDTIRAFLVENAQMAMSVAIVFGLLILSAFFSTSETALTAASRPRMHALQKDGLRGAARVNRLIAEPDNLIGAILLGNNLVNIAATSLATSLLLNIYGENGVAMAALGMTLLILVFAEIMPKTFALNNSDKVAMAVSGPVALFVAAVRPLVRTLQFFSRGLLWLLGMRPRSDIPTAAMEEIRGAIDLHAAGGSVAAEDRRRLGGVLDLKELSVGDVMVHRKAIRMIDADLPAPEIVRQVLKSPHTRLPLYRGGKEEIVGILHARDLLRGLAGAGTDPAGVDVPRLARPPVFVPETTSLRDQLDTFLRQRSHFALVVDEYGALMGLVTLEDILEEIVGDIQDEHDSRLEGVRRQADGSVKVDGWVTIRDLNRAMNWELPDEEAVTIAGLVIHEAQTIPEAGRRFVFHGYEFDIMGKERNQITLVRIRRQGGSEA